MLDFTDFECSFTEKDFKFGFNSSLGERGSTAEDGQVGSRLILGEDDGEVRGIDAHVGSLDEKCKQLVLTTIAYNFGFAYE